MPVATGFLAGLWPATVTASGDRRTVGLVEEFTDGDVVAGGGTTTITLGLVTVRLGLDVGGAATSLLRSPAATLTAEVSGDVGGSYASAAA